MIRTGMATIVSVVVAVALVATGCTAVEPRPGVTDAQTAATPTPTKTPLPTFSTPPTPTQPTRSYDAEREASYQAEIAAWEHPVPDGYAWPDSWTDIPWLGIGGQQAHYLNAAGIYHCMMVGAAWDAYFTANDPVASKEYAAKADEFAPDFESAKEVTNEDGTINDGALAAETGICHGFVGDLTE